MDDEVRVLVVDDDADVAESYASALALDGYIVRIAQDGDSALQMAGEFDPHCVLLDINMRGMDGAELSRRLRALYGDAMVLIAVTGASNLEPKVIETFGRVDHYLQKPFNLKLLRKALPRL